MERPRKTDKFAAEMDAKIREADVEIEQIDSRVSQKKAELKSRFAMLQRTVSAARQVQPRFLADVTLPKINGAHDAPLCSCGCAPGECKQHVHAGQPANGTHPPAEDQEDSAA